MAIETVQIDSSVDGEQWDALAASMGGGFFHCHAGAMYVARLEGSTPLFIRGLDGRGRALAVGTCTLSGSHYWPFSRYCGTASFKTMPTSLDGQTNCESDLMVALADRLRRMGAYRMIFASYHSPNSPAVLDALDCKAQPRHEYDFDLTRSLDDLHGSFRRQKRRQIRRADDAGVVTRELTTEEGMGLVVRFHNESMARRNQPPRRYDPAVVEAHRELIAGGRVRVMVSYLGDEPIGAEMLGCFNGLAYGLVSGSSDAGNAVYGSIALTWHVMRVFKSESYRCLSFGGAKQSETGLRAYKQEFGTRETYQPTGERTISRLGASLERLKRCISWR